MTVRHVVVFRWKPDTPPDAIAAVAAGLATMPALIPQIRDFRFGTDIGVNETNWDFAVVADFASAEDFAVYRDDPRHRAVIADRIAPHLAERASVQFTIE